MTNDFDREEFEGGNDMNELKEIREKNDVNAEVIRSNLLMHERFHNQNQNERLIKPELSNMTLKETEDIDD